MHMLLEPLDASVPCGADLSFSSKFDAIAEMRRADDPSLDQGEWVTPLKTADWPGVAAHCVRLLQHESKDLRLAMWLTEAWAMTDGFPGLARGLKVCRGLCEHFWDALHPQPDDGDWEQRIGNVRWLLQRIERLAEQLPITPVHQGLSHDLATVRRARLARHQQTATQPTASTDGAPAQPTMEQVLRALQRVTPEWLQRIDSALADSEAELLTWQAILDMRLGDAGPSFVAAKEAFAQARHDWARLCAEAGTSAPSAAPSATSAADPQAAEQAPMPAASATPVVQAALHTRQQALQQLREVAAFFRHTEPHSPVAYLADKAVAWGNMPLHEWLRQVVKEQGALAHIEELLGVPPAADGTEPAA